MHRSALALASLLAAAALTAGCPPVEPVPTDTDLSDPCPIFGASTGQLAFGTVDRGEPAALELVVANECSGAIPLVVDAALEGDPGFRLRDRSETVPPGELARFLVEFTSFDPGARSATLTLSPHDGLAAREVSLTVTVSEQLWDGADDTGTGDDTGGRDDTDSGGDTADTADTSDSGDPGDTGDSGACEVVDPIFPSGLSGTFLGTTGRACVEPGVAMEGAVLAWAELGFGSTCGVRLPITASAPVTSCAECTFAFELEYGTPVNAGTLDCSDFGLDGALISELVGLDEISYDAPVIRYGLPAPDGGLTWFPVVEDDGITVTSVEAVSKGSEVDLSWTQYVTYEY